MSMLLDSIRTHINSLSKSEKKVAATILANPQLALAENLTALAKNAEVSEPTVIRFCRAIGYEGWHDFKLKLAQSLALALPGADETLAQDDLAADAAGGDHGHCALYDKTLSRASGAGLLFNQVVRRMSHAVIRGSSDAVLVVLYRL